MLRMLLAWRIMHELWRNGHVLHPQLIAIVAGGGPTQREQQHLGRPRLIPSHTSSDAGPIMIAQNPVGPGPSWESSFIRIDYLAKSTGLPSRQRHKLEIEGQVNLVELLAVVLHHMLHWQIELADEHALAIAIHHGTHLSHDLMNARLVLRVAAQLASIGPITRLPLWGH